MTTAIFAPRRVGSNAVFSISSIVSAIPSITVKTASAYQGIVGFKVKKNGIYVSVSGLYVKVAGVYQSISKPA
jgi:hypothetical protein